MIGGLIPVTDINSTLFGGPSQPNPLDERGGIQRARTLAQQDEATLNVNQYENDAVSYATEYINTLLIASELASTREVDRTTDTCATPQHQHHLRGHWHVWDHDWDRTVLQASQAFGNKTRVRFLAGLYMSELMSLLSVCTTPGDRVPGPRSLALLSPVEFPWRDSVDAMEEVGSKEAFSLSLRLSREGLICGPSSGFNLQGSLALRLLCRG